MYSKFYRSNHVVTQFHHNSQVDQLSFPVCTFRYCLTNMKATSHLTFILIGPIFSTTNVRQQDYNEGRYTLLDSVNLGR